MNVAGHLFSHSYISGLAKVRYVTTDYLLGLVENTDERPQNIEFSLAPDDRKIVQAIRNENFVVLFQTLAKLVKSKNT